jgi:hypothetical protein
MSTRVSIERLRELFEYCEESGRPIHKTGTGYRKPGDVVGPENPTGRMSVRVDGMVLKYSRVVWMVLHGEVPNLVDHINRDTTDNRRCNLRNVGNSLNSTVRDGTSTGIRNIHYCNFHKKFVVVFKEKGRRLARTFKTLDDAAKFKENVSVKFFQSNTYYSGESE